MAEKSKRIEELGLILIKKILSDINVHQNIIFIVSISPKFLIGKKLYILLDLNAGKERNLIFALNKILLNETGAEGLKGLAVLKEKGIRILADCIENITAETAYRN